MSLNVKRVIFLIEIILLFYLLYLIYNLSNVCDAFSIEHFRLADENDKSNFDPKLKELHDKLKPMFADNVEYNGILEGINRKRVLNELSLYKGDKSYTINKENIYLCLKDENDKYYNDMMLIYVLLHEVSHSLCNEIGHTEKFTKIFKALLDKATQMKIYDPSVQIIRNYCSYKK